MRPDQQDTDDEITDALRVVYDKDPMVHSGQIGIRTRDREVTLGGLVSVTRSATGRSSTPGIWAPSR